MLKFPSSKNWLISLNHDVDRVCREFQHWNDGKLISDLEFYTVVLEDRRFFSHIGFDFLSILREFSRLITLRRHGGASTIDMQFVRTVAERYEYSFYRKFREVMLSVLIQFPAEKVVIIRSYLELAYFGNGLRGADAAAMAMFGRNAGALRGYDAAFIAAMLVYPRPANPTGRWHEKVNRRAIYGLKIGARLEKGFQKIGMR
ncbi:MAG: biosynthetic peptidoglycan transglycosylase [Parvibaculum sp.]